MPAYKDAERMTPEQLAEFILKERICKNCKWWQMLSPYSYHGNCKNYVVLEMVADNTDFLATTLFGCNQWEAK